jgi:hypothetical protein
VFAAFDYDVLGKKFGEIYWDPEKSDTLIKNAVFFNEAITKTRSL